MIVDVLLFPGILFTQWDVQISSVQFNDFDKYIPDANRISIKV